MTTDKRWTELGLTDSTIEELYRRGREYAARRMVSEHREDAVQYGMCEVLREVLNPRENYPEGPAEQLDYLTKALHRESMKWITRKLAPDTNIPCNPE